MASRRRRPVSARSEIDDAAKALLLLYERAGIDAVFLTVDDASLTVLCQREADVLPICRKVADEYWRSSDETLN